jgi:ribosomal protein L16 Arg81 hydroxylase
MRGEEMMMGAEKKALEEEVWGKNDNGAQSTAWEAELGPGDGLFIPKGWWHSVKGIGEGMTGSVCLVLNRCWRMMADMALGQLVVSMTKQDMERIHQNHTPSRKGIDRVERYKPKAIQAFSAAVGTSITVLRSQ